MHVQNTSMTQPVTNLIITFDYDFRLYAIRRPLIHVRLYILITVQCVSSLTRATQLNTGKIPTDGAKVAFRPSFRCEILQK